MNKKQLFNKLEHAWVEFKGSYAGLSDSRITEPGVIGNWSVKDILAHVTTWEEEALKYLPLILEGGTLPRYRDLYGGMDAFNAKMIEQKRVYSLAYILEQLEKVHQRLINYLNSVPEEQFLHETRFRHRLRIDTYSHYPQHAYAIRAWRDFSS